MTQHAARRWCFTINNPSAAERAAFLETADNFEYLVYGNELGDSGTPHLQGYCILKTKLRLRNVKLLRGFERAHLEVSRGTPAEAANYCKKDGDFNEYGTLPASQGKRTDFGSLKEWIKSQSQTPSHADIAEEFPSLWGRYKSACLNFVELFGPKIILVEGELRPWQRDLDEIINAEPDDRTINFIVDPDGNKGKSWLVRYWFSSRSDIQRLSIGKRDDLAYALDISKRCFLFDIPRTQLEFLQYSVLEQIKDRMVFSAKYESTCKIIQHAAHVFVFTNEEPDMDKMSHDRYNIINI